MAILVTGGAGYVGSVVAEALLEGGHQVIVLDNLSQGHRDAVPPEASFVSADLMEPLSLNEVFQHFDIEAVMHMAAETLVEYSMTDPRRHFQTNVVGSINLLEAMLKHDVHELVFSSSAAIYGEPQNTPISEEHAQLPINAYGESKLMIERILYWYERAYGLKSISLRYFNAAGASKRLGEDHRPETHLIPNVLKVPLGQSKLVPIFGTDYQTRDGTCIRDYVHVQDIAQAHILALGYLDTINGTRHYNLGSSHGYSVLDVVDTAKKVTGVEIPVEFHPRRSGDPATLVASSDLARADLSWNPQHSSLGSIIESAWMWLRKYPEGYKD